MPFELLQVDVFTELPLEGNPLAVVPDARGLDPARMQSIAREMNLSETTFVFPAEASDADYRLRIFTPRAEIPFAGHPSVGTAHALLECGLLKPAGERFSLRQRTGAGIQRIDVENGGGGRTYAVELPAPSFAPAPARAELARALDLDPAEIAGEPASVRVGVAWHVVPLRSLAAVRDLAPDLHALAALERRTGAGTTVFCREAAEPGCSVRLRSFAPDAGVPEDPVCGSGNGCVGAYLVHSGLARAPFAYEAEQGSEVGRPGRVRVTVEQEASALRVRVGGRAVVVLRGTLLL